MHIAILTNDKPMKFITIDNLILCPYQLESIAILRQPRNSEIHHAMRLSSDVTVILDEINPGLLNLKLDSRTFKGFNKLGYMPDIEKNWYGRDVYQQGKRFELSIVNGNPEIRGSWESETQFHGCFVNLLTFDEVEQWYRGQSPPMMLVDESQLITFDVPIGFYQMVNNNEDLCSNQR